MSTIYGKSSDELRAPLANGATRYTGSAALIAAIRAAALAAPEFDPVSQDATRGHYLPGPGRREQDCAPVFGPMPEDTPQHLDCFRRGAEWREDWHGPVLPMPARFVAFHYTVNGARGRWIAPNVRGADADDAYRRPCGLFGLALKAKSAALAFDGKARKAARPSIAKGSAPHVTARALWAEQDYRGALMVADAQGPVFFGAVTRPENPPNLYMRPEPAELFGAAFVVARSVESGRFRVLHESSGLAADVATSGTGIDGRGFTSAALALAWCETAAACDEFASKIRAAIPKAAPIDQSAARIALETFGAAAPADAEAADELAPEAARRLTELRETLRQFDAGEPCTLDPHRIGEWRAELAALESGADEPEAAAMAQSDAPTAEDTGASSAPVLARPGAPSAADAGGLIRSAWNDAPADPDAARSAIVARTVSLADWEARTGERCTGDAGIAAAARELGALVGAYPFAARFNLAIELGREGDASARPILRAVLAAIAAASHLPEAADAARILAALDRTAPPAAPAPAAAPRHATSGGPMPAYGIERADAATPCYAIPTEAPQPPATQSEAAPVAAHGIDSAERSCSAQYDGAPTIAVSRARAAYLLRAGRSRGPSHRPVRTAPGVYELAPVALTVRTARRYRFAAILVGTDSHRIESHWHACTGAGLAAADMQAARLALVARAEELGGRVWQWSFADYALRVWCERPAAVSPPAGNTGANPAPVPPATQSAPVPAPNDAAADELEARRMFRILAARLTFAEDYRAEAAHQSDRIANGMPAERIGAYRALVAMLERGATDAPTRPVETWPPALRERIEARRVNRLRDAASALHCGRVYPLAIFHDGVTPCYRRNLRISSIEHTGSAVVFAARWAGVESGRAFTADALHVLAAIRRGERHAERARRAKRAAPPSGNTGAVDELAGFERVSSYTGPKCSGASLPDAKAWASTEGKRNPAERFRIVPFTGDRGDAPQGMRAFGAPAPKRTQRYAVERWRAVAPLAPIPGATGAAEAARLEAVAERAEAIGNARRAEVARELAAEALRPPAADCAPPATHSHTDRPCAAPGLTSYRARGGYGWIMIGAKDDADALREAKRSTDAVATLERWDGSRYLTCDAFRTFDTDRADELKAAPVPGFTSRGAVVLQTALARVRARNPGALVVECIEPAPVIVWPDFAKAYARCKRPAAPAVSMRPGDPRLRIPASLRPVAMLRAGA